MGPTATADALAGKQNISLIFWWWQFNLLPFSSRRTFLTNKQRINTQGS